MDNTAKNYLLSLLAAVVVGLIAFILSFLSVFATDFVFQFLIIAISIGIVLITAAFISFVFADKTRALQEAVCSCGKLIFTAAGGLIISGMFTLLLIFGTVTILTSIGFGLTFFFLTLLLAAITCFIHTFYRCHRPNC